MSLVEDEIAANFAQFHTAWQAQLRKNVVAVEVGPTLLDSYRRLTAIQALKSKLVVPFYSDGSAKFFIEAQNDGLISHVNASVGSWRSALQSLRSMMENALNALYYKDHPIELQLWEGGQFRLGAAELRSYLSRHPSVAPHEGSMQVLASIETEYATLSKAVHASATNFRMTEADSGISLWNSDAIKLGMWSTRHQKVVQAIALLLALVHADKLQGTAQSDLRGSLYFAISASKRAALKKSVKVTIPAP